MAVVAGGLGQPEAGAIAAGGLGAGEPSGPSPFVNLTLTVTATSTASITAVVDTSTPPPTGGSEPATPIPAWRIPPYVRRRPSYVDFTLDIAAAADVTIDAHVTFNFDAELEQLLLLDVI